MVKVITLEYGLILELGNDRTPIWGFRLRAELRTKDGKAGERHFYRAESGLDPQEAGRRLQWMPIPDGFVPRDTFGRVRG